MKKVFTFLRIQIRKWFNPKFYNKLLLDTITYLYLKFKGVETSFGYVKLYGFPRIVKHPKSKIIFERNITITSRPHINPTGINHRATFSTHSPEAIIHIKTNVGMSGVTICSAEKIIIGNNVALGSDVIIYDTDFHALLPQDRFFDNYNKTKKKTVIIEDNVWIGGHSIILKGVTIGNSSIIGAGSVVTKDVPQNTIYAGNPAKFIKKIELE